MDDSEAQALRPRKAVCRPGVLLISADPHVRGLLPELGRSSVEPEVTESLSTLECRANREGGRSVEVVFLDLELAFARRS